MPLILAEFCGRWGCTWQEGILSLFLVALFSKGGWILLLGIPFLLFLVGLFFVGGFRAVYEFFVDSDTSIDSKDKVSKLQQAGKQVLPKAKLLGRTVRVTNKAIKNYQQEQHNVNQVNPQQLDIPEPAENAVNNVSNETVDNTVESQPQRQRIRTTAKFLGRNLRNIAKD